MSQVVSQHASILVTEDMLRQVWEQAEIIHVLQEDLQKVKGGKEPIDGGGGIYVDLGVGRSEGVVARNLGKDADQGREWRRSNDDDARETAIKQVFKQVFKKVKLNKFNGEKKTE